MSNWCLRSTHYVIVSEYKEVNMRKLKISQLMLVNQTNLPAEPLNEVDSVIV